MRALFAIFAMLVTFCAEAQAWGERYSGGDRHILILRRPAATRTPTPPVIKVVPVPTPTPTTPPAAASVDCFRHTKMKTVLTDEQTLVLCRCAENLAPLECYLDARRTTTLQDHQILQLCVGTANTHLDANLTGCPNYRQPAGTRP